VQSSNLQKDKEFLAVIAKRALERVLFFFDYFIRFLNALIFFSYNDQKFFVAGEKIMKLKIILCSLIGLSVMASDDSAHRIDPKSLIIQMVPLVIGRVTLQRPMTPTKTNFEEIQLEEDRWKQRPENKQGPIRTSSQLCDPVRKEAMEAFAVRKAKAMLEDKVKKDVHAILRQNYLKTLEQVFNVNHTVLSVASSAVESARRMEFDIAQTK